MANDGPLTPEDEEKIKALSEQFAKKYNCTYICAKRSVVRNFPSEENAEAEIDAKCNRRCLVLFGVFGNQRKYLEKVNAEFYVTGLHTFPYLSASSLDTVALTNATGKELKWGDVLKCMSGGDLLSRVTIVFLKGLPPVCRADADEYEKLFQQFIIQEGIRRVVGFNTMHDGYVPLMDYFADRISGRTAADLAAVLSLCVFSDHDDAAKHGIALEVPDAAEVKQPCEEDEREQAEETTGSLFQPPVVRKILGNSVATSLSSRQDKGNVQRMLKAHNLNYIRSVDAYNGAAACEKRKSAGIDFPVIVKPVSGAGSEFIFLCHDDDDVRSAFDVAHNRNTTQGTLAGHMIIEEYIDGPEYIVNAVGHRDVQVVTDVWKSRKFPAAVHSTRLPHHIEKKLIDSNKTPATVTSTTLLYDDQEFVHSLSDLPEDSEARRVVDYTLQCLTALGMYNGCSHCELRVDDRPRSPRRGQPVLIELNPRPQGDAPRATGLVGYDQYSLLFYTAAASAAFPERATGRIARAQQQCALPWPPAPKLYQSLHDSSVPLAERQTVKIIFLNSPFDGVLCTYGARKIQALPTFKRTARSNIFEPRDPGFIASVFKTVDLLSSPGAVLLEGTSSQVEHDAKIIRRLEQGNEEFAALLEELNYVYQSFLAQHNAGPLYEIRDQVKRYIESADFPPLYVETQHFRLLVRQGLGTFLACQTPPPPLQPPQA